MSEDDRGEAATVADEKRRADAQLISGTNPDAIEFLKNLVKESDRGVLLVVGTYLEGLLEQLLSAAFGGTDLYDEFNAPLGTFSAKIKAVHVLGLISDEFAFNLDQIRRARNHCAHHIANVTFDDEKIIAHVRNLRGVGDDADERWRQPGSARKLWFMSRLGFFLGGMMGWVKIAKPVIERRPTASALEAIRTQQARRNAERPADAGAAGPAAQKTEAGNGEAV